MLTEREVAENAAAGEDVGAPVVAEDADDDILTYRLSSPDADPFEIDGFHRADHGRSGDPVGL